MKKLKISDCLTQAQPFLEKLVINEKGETIAKLRALNFKEKQTAQIFAIDMKKHLDMKRVVELSNNEER